MRGSMKSRGLKFLMILASVMAVCTVTVAENANEDLQQAEILTGLEQRMLKRISIDFRDTPIDDVIRIIAEQADVDIVKSPKVVGTVTATLTDVPLEEALDNILTSHSYGYVTGKNMIRIAPVADITQKAESLDSKVYHITYADVEQVEKALGKFVSKRGSLSASLATSHIIVTDTESNIKAIDTFIDEIDCITPQILVEVRIYDITSTDTLDLGVEWSAGRRTNFTVTGDLGTNPSGPTETSPSHISPFGTGLFSNPTNITENAISGLLRFGWLNPNLDIDVMLKAQQEVVDAKLLANPRILVLDNEKALFDIVREIPYEERTISSDGSTIITVKFRNVGVKLEVVPHVTREGMVRLHIVPEFSVFVRRETLHVTTVPVVDTRKVNTITLVKSGHTVVLGGMRKKEISAQVNKVPLLGDLPLIGGLFRFEGESTAVSELVVFITPRIISRPVMSQAEELAYEVTEFSGPRLNLTKAEEKESEE